MFSPPSVIFLELTDACDYSCRHCRASATLSPSPDTMGGHEKFEWLARDIRRTFGTGMAVVITGGNFLMADSFESVIGACRHEGGLRVAVSPPASRLLEPALNTLVSLGVSSLSLSLDGGRPATHDWLRNMKGSFTSTLRYIELAKDAGMRVQVNTVVHGGNVAELPPLVLQVLREKGVDVWEVFFLIRTGRGTGVPQISMEEYLDTVLWLSEVGRPPLVRTVEGPLYRAVKANRDAFRRMAGKTYRHLRETSAALGIEIGPSPGQVGTHPHGGTLFISHSGDVYPSASPGSG